jgi:hypothetical protein
MKNKNFLLILIILFFFSCQPVDNNNLLTKKNVENQIISKTAQQLKKEKNLRPIGFGKSSLENNEFLKICFNYFESISIEKARVLIIFAAQKFLKNLNDSESLNKLIKKPYTMKNIAFEIFIYYPDYSKPAPPNLCLLIFEKNHISYFYDNGHFVKFHEESYDEALEKLKKKEKQMQISQTNNS